VPECLKRHEGVVAEIQKSRVFDGLTGLIEPLALRELTGEEEAEVQ